MLHLVIDNTWDALPGTIGDTARRYAQLELARRARVVALWGAVLERYGAIHGSGPSAMRLASEGHRNAIAIIQDCIEEASGCSCGDDHTCLGYDPRNLPLAEALRELLEALQ